MTEWGEVKCYECGEVIGYTKYNTVVSTVQCANCQLFEENEERRKENNK